jgi:integrase
MTTIALLEDEADLREEVADFLESCGHRVLQAGSLAEFPPLLSQARIVILDVMLPDGSGFDAVRQINNPVVAAYLECLLLTGARPGEVLGIRWADINTQWRSIAIRDKVEGERVIPLTPYVQHLLTALPRRNEWVFSSTRTLAMDAHNQQRRQAKATKRGIAAPEGTVMVTSGTGHIIKPNAQHDRACKVAGIDDLTLHGLRRSFSSLTEWLEVPAGVVAQIQGHKPSATAEKHYKRRPLDLLRVHHERIEAWILEQAGLPEPKPQTSIPLQLIGNR